ncbi:hypothetical protein B5S28_g3696 [[Candida] boidinii]|nr:hypothetical protein B5S28_g3696 [[Candida] boidinii]OWB62123.1 hypothetical protein B5S29_g3040 [[Candida] boidinii]OWB73329.1 hypothetical protein B5S31_g3067 [[Candida] boidinii]OWB78241.1 hypothetical protein B5S32_g2429 [[Candida] boidinii]
MSSGLNRSGTWKLSPRASMDVAEKGGDSLPASSLMNDSLPDSAGILANRYDKYLSLVSNIESFISSYLGIISSNSKGHEKVKKTLYNSASPQFEVNPSGNSPVSGSVGANGSNTTENEETGVNGFIDALRKTIDDNQNRSIETEDKIKTQILPELHKLNEEITTRRKEFVTQSSKEEKELKKLHQITSKEISKLSSSIGSYDNSNKKVDYHDDPYLLKRSILHHGEIQIKKENLHLDFLESSENTIKILENQIIVIIKKVFNSFSQLVCDYYGNKVNSFNDLTLVLNSIPDNYEWNNFQEKNKDLLISSGSSPSSLTNNAQLASSIDNLTINDTAKFTASSNKYKRDIKDITFPNDNHTSTAPILEGLLLKREGTLNKKYNSYYYVITKSRYLLEFQSRSMKESHHPSVILYLPDCLLGSPSSPTSGHFKFILQGKDLSQVLIKTKKKYHFQASSYDEMLTWYNIISEVSGLMHSNEELRNASLIRSDDEDEDVSSGTAPSSNE